MTDGHFKCFKRVDCFNGNQRINSFITLLLLIQKSKQTSTDFLKKSLYTKILDRYPFHQLFCYKEQDYLPTFTCEISNKPYINHVLLSFLVMLIAGIYELIDGHVKCFGMLIDLNRKRKINSFTTFTFCYSL